MVADQTTQVSPNPAAVYNVADLAAQLSVLRHDHGRTRPYGALSLRDLARHTSIPRSTLHTYFSGGALAPAAALDAILIALGCPPATLRDWASARERIAASSFGSPTRHALPANSRLLELAAKADQACGYDRPEAAPAPGPDTLDQVSTIERAHIAEDRSLARLDVQTVIRARCDGLDRYHLRIGPKPGQDPDRVAVFGLLNCTAGEHQTVLQPGVRSLELVFDHPLRAGETYLFEFSVDFAAARIPDTAATVTTELLRGFRRAGMMYALEAVFPKSSRPAELRQIHLSHIDADENLVGPVSVTQWSTAQITLEQPAAGLHGLRWDWAS